MPAIDPAAFGLSVQPMVHVGELGPAIDFYVALGGRLVFGSRDGDWALIAFGATALSLLARPPSATNPEPVELQFIARAPLDAIADHRAATAPAMIERGVGDEAFGRMLQLRTAEGLVVKLLDLDRDLIE